jgi:hypothetical protein
MKPRFRNNLECILTVSALLPSLRIR